MIYHTNHSFSTVKHKIYVVRFFLFDHLFNFFVENQNEYFTQCCTLEILLPLGSVVDSRISELSFT